MSVWDRPWLELALLALLAIGLAELLRQGLRRWWRSVRARSRGRQATQAERRAARLLRRAGFEIEAVQPRGRYSVLVDERPRTIDVRADYLVRRSGRRLVAEVKSGRVVTEVSCAATRRQLLEYLVAYEVDGVLLVDMTAGRVREVRFPPSAT